mmetsp:Transcript_2003/g.2250  ORF Transcript_2003/g.2250 Transcript_2003/m.2250 type:complete len:105 (+) Transcript_2003:493-807(+)
MTNLGSMDNGCTLLDLLDGVENTILKFGSICIQPLDQKMDSKLLVNLYQNLLSASLLYYSMQEVILLYLDYFYYLFFIRIHLCFNTSYFLQAKYTQPAPNCIAC